MMNRRAFLASLCALVGVAAVPSIGFSFPVSAEPVSWLVEEEDFGFGLAVAAQWWTGTEMLRNAVVIADPGGVKMRELQIAYCKQALRQWYAERHLVAA